MNIKNEATYWMTSDYVDYNHTKSTKHALNDKRAILNRLYSLLALNEISLSVVIYPWPEQILRNDLVSSKQQKFWQDFCKSRCEVFVDLFQDFGKVSDKYGKVETIEKYYINGDVHFNNEGNHLIGEILIDRLRFR